MLTDISISITLHGRGETSTAQEPVDGQAEYSAAENLAPKPGIQLEAAQDEFYPDSTETKQ